MADFLSFIAGAAILLFVGNMIFGKKARLSRRSESGDLNEGDPLEVNQDDDQEQDDSTDGGDSGSSDD